MSQDLEGDMRALYGAYEYLRDHELVDRSTTARLLHQKDLVLLAQRVRDELDELAGTIAGTHDHGHGRDDSVLEAYQSLYWLTVLAVAGGDRYDDLRPHEILKASASGTIPSLSAEEWLAAMSSISTNNDNAGNRRQALREGFAILARLCRDAGIDPAEAIQRDLQELRDKPYLAPYWATRAST